MLSSKSRLTKPWFHTIDMGIVYSRESKQQLLRYADAGYISDLHKDRSQTGMCFIVMVLLFHEDLSNKQWWPHHQIIQKYWQFMKQVVNIYG